jgi:hypothetical protein
MFQWWGQEQELVAWELLVKVWHQEREKWMVEVWEQ